VSGPVRGRRQVGRAGTPAPAPRRCVRRVEQSVGHGVLVGVVKIAHLVAEVVARLGSAGSDEDPLLKPFVADVEALLETVVRIDGGTRSVVADHLPAETAAEFDAEAVVETMQVLERYDLVVLEGNTWRPGPALAESDRFGR
jgi:hypothetical protein